MVSAIPNSTVRLPGGRRLVESVNARTVGGSSGPDVAERAKTLSHVVAVARDDTGEAASEVHLEGPSPYSLTGERIAWAAQRLASGAARTAGVVGPVTAFGPDELVAGCAGAGLARM